MKCPVCDQENSTILCSQCGFDASRDYERYPTFGTVHNIPSNTGQRRAWQLQNQDRADQITALIATLSVLRYQRAAALTATLQQLCHRKMAAESETEKPLRMANLRIRQLENELRKERELHEQCKLDLKSARDDAASYKQLFQEQTENHRQEQRLIEILQREQNDQFNALLQSTQCNQELKQKLDASEKALKSALDHIKTLEDALSYELKNGVSGKILDRMAYFLNGVRREMPKRPWEK